jgi:hypothetical protein
VALRFYRRDDPRMAAEFLQDLRLDSNGFDVFFLPSLIVRVTSPDFHWRLDNAVWARTKEL